MGERGKGRTGALLRRLGLALLSLSPALPFALSLTSCATPVRPSGGPQDTTPPRLVAATPAEGATNVAADRLVLEFSERVDAVSVTQALTVTPAWTTRPTVRVRGRQVEVVFPDSLRPQTTYVVTLGRGFRDEHGVALAAPITLAFATGARLDRGRIAGTVRDPRTNAGAGGLAVLAYRLADSTAVRLDPRTAAPDYRTETTAEGAFQLDYLRPGPFFVVALDDRNRNAQADPGEPFAVPPSPLTLAVEPEGAASDTTAAPPDSSATRSVPALDLFVAQLDTIPPAVRAARARSARRFAVRFDEAIRLPEAVTLADSAGAAAVPVEAAWVAPEAPAELVVLAERPVAAPVRLGATVADSLGNAAEVGVVIAPSAAPDTAAARFAGFLPPGGAADSVFLLRPDAAPGVRFTQPLDSLALRARVAVRGPEGPLAFAAETDDGVSYRLRPEGAPRAFRVEVAGPDTLFVRRYARPGPDALGGIVGHVEANEGPVLIEAFPEDRGTPFTTVTGAEGAFALRNLLPGTYRLRLVLDRNGNGRWDGGRLAPYAPPEPLRWLPEPVRVRARWETDVEAVRMEDGG